MTVILVLGWELKTALSWNKGSRCGTDTSSKMNCMTCHQLRVSSVTWQQIVKKKKKKNLNNPSNDVILCKGERKNSLYLTSKVSHIYYYYFLYLKLLQDSQLVSCVLHFFYNLNFVFRIPAKKWNGLFL